MKPFDLQAAKAGDPVQTKDGNPARIICFDKKGTPDIIVALVKIDNREAVYLYKKDGCYLTYPSDDDLVMAPVKREGWVYIFRELTNFCTSNTIYKTAEEAAKAGKDLNGSSYISIAKIEWEE